LQRIEPDDLLVQRQLAEAYMADRQYEAAIRVLERLKLAEPGNLLYELLIGWSYYGLEAWADAVRVWTAVTLRDPNAGEAHAGLAGAHFHAGDYDRAWRAVQECQRLGIPLTPDF